MPIYDTICIQCKKNEEIICKSSDYIVCSSCGGRVEKIIGQTHFRLKGGGWAKDLYGNSQKKQTETRN